MGNTAAVNASPRSLTKEELALAREVIDAQAPGRVDLLDALQSSELTPVQREQIAHLITLEFAGSGLRSDDEPNERGLRLESLLDEINRPNLRRG